MVAVLRDVLRFACIALGVVAAAFADDALQAVQTTDTARGGYGKRLPASELLRDFKSKLHAEGLALDDVPMTEQAQFALFAELGFASAIEQTKLRKAIKELKERDLPVGKIGQRADMEVVTTATTTQRMQPSVPQRSASRGMSHAQMKKDVEEMKQRLAERNRPKAPGGKPRVLPPLKGEVSAVIYLCGRGHDGKRPFVRGAAISANQEPDRVPAYSSGDTFVYRYNGYWHIGDAFPAVPTYSCGPACSPKDLRTPPLGVDFENVDSDVPDLTVQISDLPCKFVRKAGQIVRQDDRTEL